jgi:hypothetical protein
MNTYQKFEQAVVFTVGAMLLFVAPCIVTAQTITGSSVAGQNACDSEMRNHDSAFLLLLETYREFQNNLIQIDYRNRLSAAAALPDIATRKEVIALAKQERDLRLRRLTAQLVAFSAIDDNSSRGSKREARSVFYPAVHTKMITRKLQGFVVIAPATDGSTGSDALQTLPSSAVLLENPVYP